MISDSAVIVICIVLAGVAVLIGWAIGHRVWQGRSDDEERREAALEAGGGNQYEYMRDLRERNKENIAATTGGLGRSQPPRYASRQNSTPMSMPLATPMSATDYSGPSRY